MLSFDPKDRPSAEQALAHDWFTTVSTCHEELDQEVMTRLGEFTVRLPSNCLILLLLLLLLL